MASMGLALNGAACASRDRGLRFFVTRNLQIHRFPVTAYYKIFYT
jgi:hypothetical protein